MGAMEPLLTPLSATGAPQAMRQATSRAGALPPATPSAPPPMAADASSSSFTSRVRNAAPGTHGPMAEGVSSGLMMGSVAEHVAGLVPAPPTEAGRSTPVESSAPGSSSAQRQHVAALRGEAARSSSSAHAPGALVAGGAANSSVTAESVLQEAIALPPGERVLFFNDLRLHLHREGLLSVRNRAAKRQRIAGLNGPVSFIGPPSSAPVTLSVQESAAVGSAPVGSAPPPPSVRAASLGQTHSHSAATGEDTVGEVVSNPVASAGAAVGRPGAEPARTHAAAMAAPRASLPAHGLEFSTSVTSTRPATSHSAPVSVVTQSRGHDIPGVDRAAEFSGLPKMLPPDR